MELPDLGGLHGLYLVLNTAYASVLGARLPTTGVVGNLRSLIGWAVTLLGVTYAWLYFCIPTLGEAIIANEKIWQWMME
jgi:hypothetical protein